MSVMCVVLCHIILVLYLTVFGYGGLNVIPERSDIVYVDSEYITNASLNVRKYSRRSPYVFNVCWTTHHVWAENITISFIIYEYLHNEYRRSFVELHYNFCKFVNEDQYIGSIMRRHKITCPLPISHRCINNVTVFFPIFPYEFPFSKGKANLIVTLTKTGKVIVSANYYISFVKTKN